MAQRLPSNTSQPRSVVNRTSAPCRAASRLAFAKSVSVNGCKPACSRLRCHASLALSSNALIGIPRWHDESVWLPDKAGHGLPKIVKCPPRAFRQQGRQADIRDEYIQMLLGGRASDLAARLWRDQ